MRTLRFPSRFAAASALLLSSGAFAQSTGASLGDPKKCAVVVQDMGDVGFRISDAQIVAEAVVKELRKRLGHDAVAYEGVFKSAAAMKRLLNAPEATTPQEAQLEWFQKCQANAVWRVRPQFGIARGKQFISVQCRKKETKDVVDEKRVDAKTFNEARDAFVAALPAWCAQMAPSSSSGVVGPADIPNEHADAGPVGMHKQEPPKPWTPPPRRD